jgi:hypothetical protein
MSQKNGDYYDIDNIDSFLLLPKRILNSDRSIRWVGITDQNGIIINERDRRRFEAFPYYRRKS